MIFLIIFMVCGFDNEKSEKTKVTYLNPKMNAFNFQSKGKKEMCGKWLTAKAETTFSKKRRITIRPKKLHFKPYLTRIVEPLIFESNVFKNKTSSMKQTRINQFLVNKNRKVKQHEIRVDDKISTFKVPVISSVETIMYSHRELWDRDKDEDETLKVGENIEKVAEEGERNMLEDLHKVFYNDKSVINPSSIRNELCQTEKNYNNYNQRFPFPKILKNSKDGIDPGTWFASDPIKEEVQFTQWLENEVDVFIEHCDENKNKGRDRKHLISQPKKPLNSEKLPHFGERYSYQVQSKREQPLAQSSQQSDEQQCNNLTFTQWFEVNLDNFKIQS